MLAQVMPSYGLPPPHPQQRGAKVLGVVVSSYVPNVNNAALQQVLQSWYTRERNVGKSGGGELFPAGPDNPPWQGALSTELLAAIRQSWEPKPYDPQRAPKFVPQTVAGSQPPPFNRDAQLLPLVNIWHQRERNVGKSSGVAIPVIPDNPPQYVYPLVALQYDNWKTIQPLPQQSPGVPADLLSINLDGGGWNQHDPNQMAIVEQWWNVVPPMPQMPWKFRATAAATRTETGAERD
jgi:hypothetical protein